MPIVFSTSSLPLPSTVARFMGLAALKKAAVALNPRAAIEDSYIGFGYFFRGPLPWKFLKLLGYFALSRLGIYGPPGGVNRNAWLGIWISVVC
ncbi:preprotein translocase subunit SECY, chloroplastic-like [Eucalyptus grandis]|uniref:preprotein translocase subunit SECY, chloroplastic-like n=1 Tax=Eucalyptus grandis TaxID=71139 RepID=UPI00192EB223|nr:preprotein translocase subunit SECY, chloroplastic-like [Eucalyptus grandis]